MKHSTFEKNLYKELFDRFQNDEFHVDFERSTYPEDFEELRTALSNLGKSEILIMIANEPDFIEVELDYRYCSKLKNI